MRTRIGVSAIILAGLTVPVRGQEAPQKPVSKAATAKPKPAPDFSVLTAFKEALLDLKGAVEVGVNREDYQHKLQAATGESLKAEARLPDGKSRVRSCLLSYQLVLSAHKLAAQQWDLLLQYRLSLAGARESEDEGMRDDNVSVSEYERRSAYTSKLEAEVSQAETDLQTRWSDADERLNEAQTCTKAKVN
jgi:hypothetical protein